MYQNPGYVLGTQNVTILYDPIADGLFLFLFWFFFFPFLFFFLSFFSLLMAWTCSSDSFFISGAVDEVKRTQKLWRRRLFSRHGYISSWFGQYWSAIFSSCLLCLRYGSIANAHGTGSGKCDWVQYAAAAKLNGSKTTIKRWCLPNYLHSIYFYMNPQHVLKSIISIFMRSLTNDTHIFTSLRIDAWISPIYELE